MTLQCLVGGPPLHIDGALFVDATRTLPDTSPWWWSPWEIADSAVRGTAGRYRCNGRGRRRRDQMKVLRESCRQGHWYRNARWSLLQWSWPLPGQDCSYRTLLARACGPSATIGRERSRRLIEGRTRRRKSGQEDPMASAFPIFPPIRCSHSWGPIKAVVLLNRPVFSPGTVPVLASGAFLPGGAGKHKLFNPKHAEALGDLRPPK